MVLLQFINAIVTLHSLQSTLGTLLMYTGFPKIIKNTKFEITYYVSIYN